MGGLTCHPARRASATTGSVPQPDPQPALDYPNRIASLVESRLPLAVESDGSEEDWDITGPAMLVAAVRHLRALERLQDGFPSGVVAWQILRSVFEYVTTFAWIAADPETRIRSWLKVRLRTEAQGGQRSRVSGCRSNSRSTKLGISFTSGA
jgi:hypothetical protein